jgi:phytol kinase
MVAAISDETPAPRIPRGEIVRKLLHMGPGVLTFLMSAIPHYDPLAWHEVAIVAVVAVIVMGTFLRMHRTVKREGEDNMLSTVFSYGLCVVVMTSLFREHTEFTCVVVAVLAFGDGSAYFAGKLWGKRKLPWNRQKSWMGTLAFVAVSAPFAALAFWFEARPATPFALALACATVAAIAGAIAESLPMKLTDNLRVGVAASVACVVTYFALVPRFPELTPAPQKPAVSKMDGPRMARIGRIVTEQN